jgi:insertion element IS1 protein InsB
MVQAFGTFREFWKSARIRFCRRFGKKPGKSVSRECRNESALWKWTSFGLLSKRRKTSDGRFDGFDRERKKVVAFQNGKKTDENCKLLIDKLKKARVRNYHTDAWESYQKYLPPENHFIGKLGTVNIERNNLNFRTHLKRLERRTICFSKSEEMHDAVIKIYVWHSNIKRHHF